MFGSHRAAAGERLPGYYLHSRIFSALPCDTVSKQHIIQLHPALFLKSALLMKLLRHLSISILTSCLNTVPGAYFYYLFLNFTSASCGEGRHLKHSEHPLTHKHPDEMTVWVIHKPVRRQTGVAPPQAIALWLLVTIVRLCSQELTSGDNGHGGKEEREPESVHLHKYIHTNTHTYICKHQKNKQTWLHTEPKQRAKPSERTHMHWRTNS